ncbi:hypothetical protein ES708_10281 [subsurface metagenome]
MSTINLTKYDIRRNPFTDEWDDPLPEVTAEELTIPGASPFHITLEEVPKYESPSTVFVYLTDTLAEPLDDSETVVTVSNGAYWEVDDIILVDDEQMLITGKSDNDLTVTRGYGGTSPAAHDDATRFKNYTSWTEKTVAPSKGEFQVHYGTDEVPYKRGLIRFHEDDGGKTVWVHYWKTGHYNWAEHINDLQTWILTKTNKSNAGYSDAESFTNSTSWQDKISFSLAVPKSGFVIVHASFKMWGLSYIASARCLVNASPSRILTTGPSYETYSIFQRIAVTAGTKTIKLQYKIANAGGTAYIKNANLSAFFSED